MPWRLRRGDRGAALVEMILFTPLLVMLAIGILEFGLAWRDTITVSSTLRAGARVGSNAGNDPLADYNSLLAVQAAVASIPNARILKIVIYRSTTTDGQIPANCKTSTTGLTGSCNVYTAAQLASLSAASFGCGSGDLDVMWCPTTRVTASATADYFGIWMQVSHPYVTKMFPGTGVTISDSTVMRLEPSV